MDMDLHGVWRHFTFHNIYMDMDMASCLHIITVTYSRYKDRPIQNRYHIIYHKSRILNIKSLKFSNISLLPWFRTLNIAVIN